MSLIAPTLEAFFTERLMMQKNASPHTVASYRDCLKLLLAYMQQTTGTAPSKLEFSDLDAEVIGDFLSHLERDRGLSAREPQRPARRDPVAIRLCGAPPPRARRAHRPRPRDPGQAGRADARELPRPG
jgi:hypothetical protein